MKVSVILTTYNGSRYIDEQLTSLLSQTRQPDEVIVLDDVSSDDTVGKVKKFIQKNGLNNWRIYVNTKNLGWKENFYRGFCMAKGDIIFPADQDDIWHKDKIEKMSDVIEKNPNINILAGGAHKFSKYRKIKPSEQNEVKTGSQKVIKNDISKDFLHRAPGCVLAIRRKYFEENKFENMKYYAHDAILPYFAKMDGSYYVYDDNVIEWRISEASASNPKHVNRLKEIEYDGEILEILSNRPNISHEASTILEKAKSWNQYRHNLVKNKDILSGLKTIRYLKFYGRKKWYISDFKYAFFG